MGQLRHGILLLQQQKTECRQRCQAFGRSIESQETASRSFKTLLDKPFEKALDCRTAYSRGNNWWNKSCHQKEKGGPDHS